VYGLCVLLLSLRGAAATGHPVCTAVAIEILKAGGNAFDAIIAAGFCSTLAEPMLCSLGGGGFLLSRTSSGEHSLFDFFVTLPGIGKKPEKPHFTPIDVQFTGTNQIFHTGPGSIAVPGVLKGFLHVHNALGRLPLKEVLAPAIDLAKRGVAMNATQAYVLKILHPIMCQCDEGNAIFAPKGTLLVEGDILKNSNLANFMEDLPNDLGRSVYAGNLGKEMVAQLKGISQLHKEDLSGYQVIERVPLTSQYRHYKIYTNPKPSLGGSLIVELLSGLERKDLTHVKWGDLDHLKILIEVMRKVEDEKEKSHTVKFKKGTTHMSVSDGEHNFASLSVTNGEGSGYFIPGTGIMVNNMLGEDDLCPDNFESMIPGERIPSMMSPCILEKDESHCIVIGSGGSKRIRSSLMQVISNVVDFNHSMKEAILRPRINWDGTTLQIEPGYETSVLDKLGKIVPTNVWPHVEFYFGGAHGVLPNSQAEGDPRRGGVGEFI